MGHSPGGRRLRASPPREESRERLIREHLDKVLQSEAFRGSKRSCDFLRFVVEKALAGESEDLKERTIAVQVFARRPDYDPAEDPVVRVSANEVRKRLAQFYQAEAADEKVRIELPTGHYVPQFSVLDGAGRRPTPSAVRRRTRWVWFGLAMVALAGGLLVSLRLLGRSSAPDVLREFWGPALSGPEPVLICLAHPVVYYLSPRVHHEFLEKHPALEASGPYIIRFDRPAVPAEDIIPVPDQYVGAGDAHSAILLTRLFSNWRKPSRVRIGSDISFSDLRTYPTVLLGANSNRWTMTVTRELPFVFRRGFGAFYIQETVGQKRRWQLTALNPNGQTPEDYALISRLPESRTGRILVAAGGITQYGTHAAGEFLSNPKYLAQILSQAPPGWSKFNFQCVIHARVTGNTPGPPSLVAVRFW